MKNNGQLTITLPGLTKGHKLFCGLYEKVDTNFDKFFCQADINDIKLFAFEKGESVTMYGKLIGVIIRDKYFEIKGIDPLDVDRHDPPSLKDAPTS